MSILERLGGRLEPCDGTLPDLTYHWDPETEILSGSADLVGQHGLTGSIELEDDRGAVVTLDFAEGVLRGIEVVVWPSVQSRDGLTVPEADAVAQLVVPQRLSQPGVAVVEIEVRVEAETCSDESIVHLRVGGGRPARTVRLAGNLLADLDRSGELAGFWLLDVPAFPTAREVD
jgi:hypothetical protein